jgi:flagellar operon protein
VRPLTFRIINGKVVPVDIPAQVKKENSIESGKSFKEVFESELNKVNGVKISGHAMERLKRRNIELDDGDIKKLSEAIDKAESKGARESLLLYKDIAFTASIRNKTIITAVDGQSAKDNVFTNIDSAVIV